MSIKLIHMHNDYGDDDFALIEAPESDDDFEYLMDDLEEEYRESVAEDDFTVLNMENYIIDTLAERGYKFLPHSVISKYYEGR